jgi:hypothetical protein
VFRRDAAPVGLRAVAAGHADDVGAVRMAVFRQLGEVVARFEDDRFDPAFPALRDQVEASGLSATRARIDDQCGHDRATPDLRRSPHRGDVGPCSSTVAPTHPPSFETDVGDERGVIGRGRSAPRST